MLQKEIIENIKILFSNFIKDYEAEAIDEIWQKQSSAFHDFWNKHILSKEIKELNDSDIDENIKYLDMHAKGNTKENQSAAAAMISQGMWRRMFNDIHRENKLHDLLSKIFIEKNEKNQASFIDELYKANEGRKNSLTGQSGNAINAMMFVFDPAHYTSIVSLGHRQQVIKAFGFSGGPDFENDSSGKKIVLSNKTILDGFSDMGINASPRTISSFLYLEPIKKLWQLKKVKEGQKVLIEEDSLPRTQREMRDPALFYMESQLEDFLIENWDKTELGQKYELIEENGEVRSQQHPTGIGKIDILVWDKRDKQYVVIELKKNQTSDDTVGQLSRYMGWLEEHKTDGKPTKGIIIAAQYDKRLYYALKKLKDVEVYLYRVDFTLKEFKE